MPIEGISKHSYLFCQFLDPEDSHEGGRCDCFDTASQKAKARAKAKLEVHRKTKATSTSKSTVPSDPAVTLMVKPDAASHSGIRHIYVSAF